jgi:bifunctional UDP-N-acetylglucosamine pyrophosphorylase/glucosamine-1-phosphate N-acetyltransferase
MGAMSLTAIILGAGAGTRMNSDLPKVLHPLAGVPMLHHAMRAAQLAGATKTVVVVGHGAEDVQMAAHDWNEDGLIAHQTEQRGTAHAVDQSRALLADEDGKAVILYGDTPFVKPETIEAMLAEYENGNSVVVLGFDAADPGKYGRLVAGKGNQLDAIVEAKDASPAQLEISLCNSGVVVAGTKDLFDLIAKVKDENASSEYYLTDIVEIARNNGMNCAYVTCDEAETLGINSRVELASAEVKFQQNARAAALENGVTLQDPNSTIFAIDTFLGRDCVIGANVVFGPGVTVETAAEVRPFCHLEGCHISQGAVVGPFARLRPGSELGNHSRVGNFVEVKNAVLGEGAKANHLSYIGDATVGDEANIGAGTITCNYDGVLKHHTTIGARAFVGSNSSLVAPLSIGADALIGSGSVVTQNVPDEALAIARAKQVNKPGLATRLREKLRALKERNAG